MPIELRQIAMFILGLTLGLEIGIIIAVVKISNDFDLVRVKK